jgi:hypothetical protein
VDIINESGNKFPWQPFRDNELYTLEVNDLLDANKAKLRELFDSNCHKLKNQMTLKECQNLFIQQTSIFKLEAKVTYIFGMSKMTIQQTIKNFNHYFRIVFVEFLELIGRAAELKFKDSDLEDIKLSEKIGFILDDLLRTIKAKRKDPKEIDKFVSISDDSDY